MMLNVKTILSRLQPGSAKPGWTRLIMACLCFLALAAPSWAQRPVITAQPEFVATDSNTTITFSVTATGPGPLTYQWYYADTLKVINDARHIGADTATLKIIGVNINDINEYYCVVSNGSGNTISDKALLTVNPTLTVISPHGSPTPAVGTWTVTSGTQVNASMTGSPAVNLAGTTRWLCSGYTGVGSAPSGNGLSLTFPLRTNSTITWNWQPQYRITAVSNPPAGGLVTLADKVTTATGQWRNPGTAQTYWALPKTNYRFGNWSGDATGTVNTFSRALNAPINLTANFIMNPRFLTQPAAKAVNSGTTVSFSVQTTATLPITYQWVRGGVKLTDGGRIHGATSSTLTIDAATYSNEGQYACRIGDGVSSASSNSVLLAINDPAIIKSNPISRAVTPGSFVVFSVSTSGTQPLTFQWKKNGAPLADGGGMTGTRTSALQISSAQFTHAGGYTCFVSNIAGSAESTTATLMVRTPPSIRTEPADLLLNPGETASFTADATGTQPLTYLWMRNGVALNESARITGVTSPTLCISSVRFTDNGRYSCVVSNPVNWVATRQASLNVRLALNVSSAHGKPLPEAGCNYFTTGTQIAATAGMTAEVDSTGTTRMLCTGWTGFGAVKASGATTQTTFKLDQDSTLTWNWKRQYRLTAECDPPEAGLIVLRDCITTATGTWFDANGLYYVRQKTNRSYVFDGWGGDAAESGMGTSASLAMTRPLRITARYLMIPVILKHPASQFVNSGATVALDTVCTGTAPLQYQWYHDGQPVEDDARVIGARSARLQIQCFKAEDVGHYECVISNKAGMANTYKAQLLIKFRMHINGSYGDPYPASGDYYFTSGTQRTVHLNKSAEYDALGTTRHVSTGWIGQGAAPAQGSGALCSFTLDRDTTVTWTWRTEYQLRVDREPAEGGVVTPRYGWMIAGTPVTVQATPYAQYDFAGWRGSVSDGAPALNLVMNRPHHLLGRFSYGRGSVRITVSPSTIPWVLTDGLKGKHAGTGNAVLNNIPCGTLSLQWNAPDTYCPMSQNTVVQGLAKNGVVNITEVFIPKSPQSAYEAARILRYMLGLSQFTEGLDLNGDGVVNVTDLLKAKGSGAEPTPTPTPNPTPGTR